MLLTNKLVAMAATDDGGPSVKFITVAGEIDAHFKDDEKRDSEFERVYAELEKEENAALKSGAQNEGSAQEDAALKGSARNEDKRKLILHMYHRFVAVRLAAQGVVTISDLLGKSRTELLKMPMISKGSLRHIWEFLVAYGHEDKARDLGADDMDIDIIKAVYKRMYPLTVEQYQKLGRYDDILEH